MVCNGVCLYRLLSSTLAGVSRLSSITSRVMPRDRSLRISRTPSITRALASSAIFSSMASTEVWYGISLTTMRSPLGPSSISALARILMDPRPVRMADTMPARPMIWAPVGKSGPLTNSIRSSGVASGCSNRCSVASMTSPRLWGGMLVAMPTAMPWLPLTSRLGNRPGRTTGSSVEPSKLGLKSTVSSSMPASMCMASGVSRHSV